MADAKGQTVSLRIAGDSSAGEKAEFGASGTVITFRGFLAAYEEGRDETGNGGGEASDEERRLPNLAEGDPVTLLELEPQGHETNPPARYTEATLVRTMEELGIGRPSTYASILGTILDRGYVFKKGTALVPSFLAFAVVGLLEQHFGRLVDYDFTARMEDDLDRIAAGDEARVEWLRRFYYGDDSDGLQQLVSDLGGIDAREINSIEIGDGIVLRVGRYGPYLERDGQRANVPEDVVPDELTVERADGAARTAVRRPRARHRSGHRPRGRRAHRPLRPVRDRGAAGGLEGEAAHRVALQVDVAGDGDARGGAAAAAAFPGCSASARTGRRSSRGTAATGRTSRRGRSRVRSSRRSSS